MQKGNLKTLKSVSDLLVYREKEAADFFIFQAGLKKDFCHYSQWE